MSGRTPKHLKIGDRVMGYKLTCDKCGCDVDPEIDLSERKAFTFKENDGKTFELDIGVAVERNSRGSLGPVDKPALCLDCLGLVVREVIQRTKGYNEMMETE